MLRSKATAALMKLKEIDRKYKMKCSVNEEDGLDSSLSDISAINETSERVTSGSGDKPEPIANRRLKLDIRMPEAHMERSNQTGTQGNESPVQIVTIFNKSPKKQSPRSGSSLDPLIKTAEETKVACEDDEEKAVETLQTASPEKRSLTIIREHEEKTETSISEDVPEVASPSHPISEHPETNESPEITLKSVASIVDAEEGAESEFDDDSIASETYSDDFLKSVTDSENAEESEDDRGKLESTSEVEDVDDAEERPRKIEAKEESEDEEIEELQLSPKLADLDVGRSDHVEIEAHLLHKSSQSSSSRSSEERREKRRPRTRINSSRDSPGSSSSKKDSEGTRNSGILNSPKRQLQSFQNSTGSGRPRNSQAASLTECGNEKELKIQQTVSFHEGEDLSRETDVYNRISKAKSNRVRAKDSVPEERQKCRSIPRGQSRRSSKRKIEDTHRIKNRTKVGKTRAREEPAKKDVDRVKQRTKEDRYQEERDRLRSRVRGYVQEMMNEQQRLLSRCRDEIGHSVYHGSGVSGLRQSPQNHQNHYFFKPLDLPNVAAFKRPDFEENQTPESDNEQYLHLRIIQERILGIRQWLRQQFVLYRDYSNLVSTINAKYIPVTLKETKRMIHDMQRFCNNPREKHRLIVWLSSH